LGEGAWVGDVAEVLLAFGHEGGVEAAGLALFQRSGEGATDHGQRVEEGWGMHDE